MVQDKVPVLPVFLVTSASVFFILEELLDICHFPLECVCVPQCCRIPLHVSALFLLWPLLGILPSLCCRDVLLMGQPWSEARLFSEALDSPSSLGPVPSNCSSRDPALVSCLASDPVGLE